MQALGDFLPGDTIDLKFNSHSLNGAPITLAGTPVVSVYKDNDTTESTSGVTLSVDQDSRTGMHHVRINTGANGAFYSNGSRFTVVITTGTVDGVSVVGTVIGTFSIGMSVFGQRIPVGPIPVLGIVDNGVAQAIGATSIQLRASLALGDNSIVGSTVIIPSLGIVGTVTAYDGTTDTATIGNGWSSGGTPSGTPYYVVFGTAPVVNEGGLDAAGVRSALGLASANLDTQLSGIGSAISGGVTVNSLATAAQNAVQTAAAAALTAYDPPTHAEMTARTLAAADYATASALQTVDNVVDGVKVVTDKLDTALEADNSDWKFTAAALAETPISGGGGLDAAGIRNAIGLASANLDTQLSSISAVTAKLDDTLELDSGAYRFTGTALAEAPTGSGGGAGASAEEVAEAVAMELGDGSGFTAITGAISGLNDLSAGQVQAAATAALVAYDPPTRSQVTAIAAKTDQLSFVEGSVAADMKRVAGGPALVPNGTNARSYGEP